MCVKIASSILLIACNVVLGICGVVILTLGILLAVVPDTFYNIIEEALGGLELSEVFESISVGSNVSIILMSVGGGLILLAIIGSCAAICCSCLKIVYAIALALLIIFSVGTLVYLASENGKQSMRYSLEKTTKSSYEHYLQNRENISLANGGEIIIPDNRSIPWVLFQTKYQCCGIYDYDVFDNGTIKTGPYRNFSEYVSLSCCKLNNDYYAKNLDISIRISKNNYTDLNVCMTSYPNHGNIQNCIDPMFYLVLKQSNFGMIALSFALLFMILCLAASLIGSGEC